MICHKLARQSDYHAVERVYERGEKYEAELQYQIFEYVIEAVGLVRHDCDK